MWRVIIHENAFVFENSKLGSDVGSNLLLSLTGEGRDVSRVKIVSLEPKRWGINYGSMTYYLSFFG